MSATVLPVSANWDFSQIDFIMSKSLLRLAFSCLKQNKTEHVPDGKKTTPQKPNNPHLYVIVSSPVFQEINIGICRLSLWCITYFVIRKTSTNTVKWTKIVPL